MSVVATYGALELGQDEEIICTDCTRSDLADALEPDVPLVDGVDVALPEVPVDPLASVPVTET